MSAGDHGHARVQDRRRLPPVVVLGTALAAAVPTALLGWAAHEYLDELKWLGSSSGWLDGVPDMPVVVVGTSGLVLLVVVTFVAYRMASRPAVRRARDRRAAVVSSVVGVAIPLVLLALVMVVWAVVAPSTSVLVPLW